MYWAIGHIIYVSSTWMYTRSMLNNTHHITCAVYQSTWSPKRKCPGPTWLAMLWSMWEKNQTSKVLVIFYEKSTQPNGFSLTQSYKETRNFSFSRVTNARNPNLRHGIWILLLIEWVDLNLASLRLLLSSRKGMPWKNGSQRVEVLLDTWHPLGRIPPWIEKRICWKWSFLLTWIKWSIHQKTMWVCLKTREPKNTWENEKNASRKAMDLRTPPNFWDTAMSMLLSSTL